MSESDMFIARVSGSVSVNSDPEFTSQDQVHKSKPSPHSHHSNNTFREQFLSESSLNSELEEAHSEMLMQQVLRDEVIKSTNVSRANSKLTHSSRTVSKVEVSMSSSLLNNSGEIAANHLLDKLTRS